MQLLAITVLTAAVCNFTLGLVVLFKDKTKIITTYTTQIFAGLCFACSIWVFANFMLVERQTVFWVKSAYVFGSIGVTLLFIWVLDFCGRKLTKTKIIPLVLANIVLFCFAYYIDIPPIDPKNIGELYAAGISSGAILNQIFFYSYFSCLVVAFCASIVLLIIEYRKSRDVRKKQFQYVLMGIFLNTFSVLFASFVLPLCKLYDYFFLFGSPSSLFFVFFSAVAITKYHLFEIKVILTEILVIAMSFLLFLLPFLIKDVSLTVFTSVIFVTFCVVGYLLIQSTLKEVRQKEILGEKVRERTKELEEATGVVKQRARELEIAKNVAEERAKEVVKRKDDLERFYKLIVGRELKLVDLQDKIQELEKKVSTVS